MPSARYDAIAALDVMPINTVVKYLLAWDHSIASWIRPCLSNLLDLPPKTLSENDISLLGGGITKFIFDTQADIRAAKTAVAIVPPPLVHLQECTRSRCGTTPDWSSYFRAAAQPLLNDLLVPPMTGHGVLEQLFRGEPKGVNSGCFIETVEKYRETGALWAREEQVRTAALDAAVAKLHVVDPHAT